MKNFRKLIFAVLAVFLLAVCVEPVHADNGFVIDKHVVEMKVEEDGSVYVKETMDVTFYYPHHGIYVNIPTSYHMTWDGTKETDYTFPVTDAGVLSSHKYSVERFDYGTQIKIGSADYYADTHETYVFEYTVLTKDLGLDGTQMLFWNIISNNWDTITSAVEFSITMPKEFDAQRCWFDGPMGLTQQSDGFFHVEYHGNVITGSYNGPMMADDALTIQLMLDDGYFTFPDGKTYFTIATVFGAILTLACGILFVFKGLDKKVIEVINFDAPDNLDSCEVGYVIDGTVDNEDVLSLILYFAKNGWLKIEELDNNDELQFTKTGEISENAPKYQKNFYRKIFKNSDVVTLTSLKLRMYKAIEAVKDTVTRKYEKKGNCLYTSIGYQILLCALAGVPCLLSMLVCTWMQYASMEIAWIWIGTDLIVFGIIAMILSSLWNRWYTTKTWVKVLCIILVALGFWFTGLLLYIGGVTINRNPLLYMSGWIFSVIMCFLAAAMRKRTARGDELLGQVLGLRTFILTAEKDRLETVAKENPYIFYDILPYAYALGLTDIWSDHFKELTIPECEWYVSSYNTTPMHTMQRLDHSMKQITQTMTTPPPTQSTGGGSSIGGGGFSGGGGGGFSGGGFGGSGGGGW
ncbi:MAG: DUF2207 domain-containing protein [Erysipelotrichaceae bacterium]|nr:DUF2207 domain-containing protein [Erysipelotrichaceae bacterium]